MAILQRSKATVYGLESDLLALTTADMNEEVARLAADASLDTKIDGESATARLAEQANAAATALEEAARISADTALQANINAEEAARLIVEAGLQANIDAVALNGMTEVSRVDNEIALLDSDIIAEENARIAADGILQSNIDAVAINGGGEVSRVDSELLALNADLAAEEASRIAADSALQVSIDEEKGRIDSILALSTVETDSFKELVDLVNSVDVENDAAFASYVLSNDSAVAQNVSDIASNGSAISAESLRATGIESGLQASINSEEASRIAADGILTGSIDAEVLRATGVESGLTSSINTVSANLAAEETARISGINTVQADVDANEVNTNSAIASLQANIDAAAFEGQNGIAANAGSIAALDADTYSMNEVDTAIALGGAVFTTEVLNVVADKIVLTHAPKNGMIFNFATVRHTDANYVSYDIPATITLVGESEFQLHPNVAGEFDGKNVVVQYAYVPTV